MTNQSTKNPKTLSRSNIRGQAGINLIEKIVLEMHSMWYPTGGIEVGIDGFIELFDQATGEALGKTLSVQSKVRNDLANESEEGFDYYCDERDLEYWLQGNMAVLLIISRPEKNEAYWISIKDYFAKDLTRENRKIQFSKTANRFDASAYAALLRIGKDQNSGLHLGPIPRSETLHSNLLPLTSYPDRIWIGWTEYRHPTELWPVLNSYNCRISGDWMLHEQSVMSFQDLTKEPWSTICDPGTCEDFDTWEWAFAQDLDQRRRFVELLNLTLKDQLYPEVRWWQQLSCYMFAAGLNRAPVKKRYRSLKQDAEITVVSKYDSTNKNGVKLDFLRHLAFRGQFRLFDDQWYLEITPTYVFTWDGKSQYRFHENSLSGIKRLEGNRAVLSSLLLWADTLAQPGDLFENIPNSNSENCILTRCRSELTTKAGRGEILTET